MPKTLQIVREARLVRLCEGPTRRFEASGVTLRDRRLFVAFDNTGRIASFDTELSPESVRWHGQIDPKEGYEAITWSPAEEAFYCVIEAVKVGKKKHQAFIRRFDVDLGLVSELPVQHTFKRANKGVEGLALVRREDGIRLLALCEAPVGKGKRRHGQILVLRNDAIWNVERTLRLPEAADFTDFSDLAVRGDTVAVVSQEDSAMWVGRLNRADWSVDQGEVFVFPRDRKGRIVYGNVEGVVWLDDACTRVAVVSDRTKDDQPGRCREKEESVHIFDLPRPA